MRTIARLLGGQQTQTIKRSLLASNQNKAKLTMKTILFFFFVVSMFFVATPAVYAADPPSIQDVFLQLNIPVWAKILLYILGVLLGAVPKILEIVKNKETPKEETKKDAPKTPTNLMLLLCFCGLLYGCDGGDTVAPSQGVNTPTQSPQTPTQKKPCEPCCKEDQVTGD